MIRKILFSTLLAIPFVVYGQSYNEQLLAWRNNYKQSLIRGNNPMTPADTSELRFFAPDEDYRIKANFTPARSRKLLLLKVSNGGKAMAAELYGVLSFHLMSTQLKLEVYKLKKSGTSHDFDLFVPFADPTNGLSTFRGGRYLNLKYSDIVENTVYVDFNKSYNPQTAYMRGFPSILPTVANTLKLDILAGEKAYGIDFGY